MSNFFKADIIRQLAAAKDQKAEMLSVLGDATDSLTLTGNDILLAVYIEREMNNGIIKADQTLKESIYQSKVGLVVKTGPSAFRFKGPYAWVDPYSDERLAHEYLDGLNGLIPKKKDTGYEKYARAERLVSQYSARVELYTPKIGDWVVFFPTDLRLMGLNGVACRYSLDTSVKMITTNPDVIL